MIGPPAADVGQSKEADNDPEDEGSHQSTIPPTLPEAERRRLSPDFDEWSEISKGGRRMGEGDGSKQRQSDTIVTQQPRPRQSTNDSNPSVESPPSEEGDPTVSSTSLGRAVSKQERQQGQRRTLMLQGSPDSSPSHYHHHPSLPTPDTATSHVSPLLHF